MSFDMTSAQQQAFSESSGGAVTAANATELIALVVSFLAITWLLVLFLGYSKKMANKEMDLMEYLYCVCCAVLAVIVVASVLFS